MKNQLKTILMLGLLSALLISIGAYLGTSYLYGFTALAVLLNFGSYFFSDRLVLAMHRAREVAPGEAPELHHVVEEVAREAGIPKPRVFVLPEAQPNAFATGRNPAHGVVAVTEGIVGLLDERELRAVLGHELGHIKNRDILVATVAAAIAAAVTYIAHVAQYAVFFGGRGHNEREGSALGSLFLLLVSPIAAALIQLGISRSREYLADETGAHLTRDPEGLARALEKMSAVAQRVPAHVEPATASLFIVSPLAGRERSGLMGLFSTHPPIEERVRRLRALARPSKDPRSTGAGGFDDPFAHHRPWPT